MVLVGALSKMIILFKAISCRSPQAARDIKPHMSYMFNTAFLLHSEQGLDHTYQVYKFYKFKSFLKDL